MRSEISTYIASITFLSRYSSNKKEIVENMSEREFYKEIEDHYINASVCFTSIYLKINTEDNNRELKKHNVKFITALDKTKEYARVGKFAEAEKQAIDFRNFVKPILKIEWERVKSGERIYQLSRNIAAFVLVSGLILSIIGFWLC